MKQKLLITLCASLCALFSFAAGTEINGIYYYLNDNNMTASVTYPETGAEKYKGDITIPSIITYSYIEDNTVHYKYYTVTSIYSNAFQGCTGLTNINSRPLKTRLSCPQC